MATEDSFVKLSDESLQRQPEEVFDLLEKLGEGSYGAVYKAVHKESGQLLAIKKVPVDTDLQEIIKEISIMQQCDSPYVVKYYGSYFKDQDLWIVMEFCGAGSVSDIMRVRKKTCTEAEIATILQSTLKGLEYLHYKRKIHRDIKAGNVLLNSEGSAKLADFGVAGQLTDTMAKRNTVIGTPFWMAPEVIQEVGYDCRADVWSLGITAMEMAEGKPPYAEIHPMRAIFMIPSKPPPTFKNSAAWSDEFTNFVAQCLVKNPENRATATSLLQHPFIKNAKPPSSLKDLIVEAMQLMKEPRRWLVSSSDEDDEEEEIDSGTMVSQQGSATPAESGTLVGSNRGTGVSTTTNSGTMVVNASNPTTMTSVATDELGTMVISDDSEEAADGTMKCMDSREVKAVAGAGAHYRPSFMDHFDKQDKHSGPAAKPAALGPGMSDYDFLCRLSYEELKRRLSNLDPDMEKEIEELRRRYQSKRQPILDAMDTKRRRQAVSP